MAKTIFLRNMKGGVGKSTLTVNIAWHFASYTNWSKKIKTVDLDPQFNASQYFVGVTKYENIIKDDKPTIWNIFEQHTKTPTGKTNFEPKEPIMPVARMRNGGKIDLIPSCLKLALSLKKPYGKEALLQKTLKKFIKTICCVRAGDRSCQAGCIKKPIGLYQWALWSDSNESISFFYIAGLILCKL
jgi:chromosome partitioning protein